MADYSLKLVQTTNQPAKNVNDKTSLRQWADYKISNGKKVELTGDEKYRTRTINSAMRQIPSNVNSHSIDTEVPYNGYNDLVKRIDDSKTEVVRENGIWGFGCTKRTITYYDKDGKELFKRFIDEDKNINQIKFRGINGCETYLWDNNNNGNFEAMRQYSASAYSRHYDWFDSSDKNNGNYDVVRMTNAPRGAHYERSYDFKQSKTIELQNPSPFRFLP